MYKRNNTDGESSAQVCQELIHASLDHDWAEAHNQVNCILLMTCILTISLSLHALM